MKKTVNKIMKILSRVWSVVVIIGIIGIFAMRWAGEPFGYKAIWCMSNSMAPTFHEGSLCYIDTNYDVDSVEEGDIIAFSLSDGSQVTHRVHSINEDGSIITKGDANDDVDISPIVKEQIIGENVLQIEYLGNLYKPFPNMLLISVVGFGLCVWILLEVLAGDSEEGKEETCKKEQ